MIHKIDYIEGSGFTIQPGIILKDIPMIEVLNSDNSKSFYPDILRICDILDKEESTTASFIIE